VTGATKLDAFAAPFAVSTVAVEFALEVEFVEFSVEKPVELIASINVLVVVEAFFCTSK